MSARQVRKTVRALLQDATLGLKPAVIALSYENYARNGPALYTDVNGIVQTAPANVLRSAHYVGGVGPQVLYEPNPATNLLLWCDQYDHAGWTARGTCTVAPNVAIAPNGTLTADQISGCALASNDIFQPVTGLVTGTRYEPSFWLQRVSTVGLIQFTNPISTASGDWRIDLSLLGSGWNWITRNHPAVFSIVNEFVGNANQCGHYFRATTSTPLSFNVWRGQLELGTVSTSSIEPATTAAPVTRAADTSTSLIPGIVSDFNFVRGAISGKMLPSGHPNISVDARNWRPEQKVVKPNRDAMVVVEIRAEFVSADQQQLEDQRDLTAIGIVKVLDGLREWSDSHAGTVVDVIDPYNIDIGTFGGVVTTEGILVSATILERSST